MSDVFDRWRIGGGMGGGAGASLEALSASANVLPLRRNLTVVRPDPGTAEISYADLGEAELVAACLNGRTAAFDVIVERHRRAVYQLCYRFVGNHEDASDLSQDVFLRAY